MGVCLSCLFQNEALQLLATSHPTLTKPSKGCLPGVRRQNAWPCLGCSIQTFFFLRQKKKGKSLLGNEFGSIMPFPLRTMRQDC